MLGMFLLSVFFTGVNKKSFPGGENNFLKFISLILILVQTFLELTIKLLILLLQHDIDLGQGLCELEISYDLLLDFFHMQELWPFLPIWTFTRLNIDLELKNLLLLNLPNLT